MDRVGFEQSEEAAPYLELDDVEPERSLTAVSALSYECIASAKLAALQNSLRRSQ